MEKGSGGRRGHRMGKEGGKEEEREEGVDVGEVEETERGHCIL